MNVQLSKRMQAVADMALPGYRVADIGCDHGFVSIYLVQAGIAPAVFAADVRPGPLSRAREHIQQAGLAGYITPVLSDGLAKVPVDGAGVQAAIAAGIGGRLTIKILSDWPEKTRALSWMVLEPQSDIHLVRQHLAETGFFILKEDMVYEDGKFYPILFAVNEADGQFAEAIAACERQRQAWEMRWTEWADEDWNSAEDQSALSGGRADEAGADVCPAAAADGRTGAKARWNLACDLFGFHGIVSNHQVLRQYLAHTIEKDSSVLAEMERTAGDAAAGGRQDAAETAAQEPRQAAAPVDRIGQRMAQIREKIALCRQVLDFMAYSAQ